MAKYKIALLPGDGIGPEVVDATLVVMDALEKKADIEFALGIDDSEIYGNVSFFSVFVYFYGGT